MKLNILGLASFTALAMIGGATAVHAAQVEVLHYYTSGSESAALNAVRQKYEAAGGKWIDSPVAGGAGDAHDQVLRARALAGNPPEIATPKNRDAMTWGTEGYLVDLEGVAKELRWDEIYPQVLRDASKVDGKWVAVPIDLQRTDIMWINPAVLAKVGAEPPRTLAEFIAVCEKLKAAGITPIALGGQPWQESLLFGVALWGVGGPELYRKVLADGDLEAIRSPETVKAFEEFRRMRGFVDDNFSGRDWNLATGMLIRGEAAFQFMGDWAKGEVLNAKLEPGKDILCLPTPREKQVGMNWSFNTFSFFAKPKDNREPSEGQKLFAKVISSPETEVAYSLKKGNIPALSDVDTSQFDVCAKWEIESAQNAIATNTLIPEFVAGTSKTAPYRGAMTDVITNFFNSEVSAKDAATALADAVEMNR